MTSLSTSSYEGVVINISAIGVSTGIQVLRSLFGEVGVEGEGREYILLF